MPMPLIGAATVEATCVPCPLSPGPPPCWSRSPLPASIGSVSPATIVGSSERTKEHDDARSRLGAMSGWLRSTPLSMMPDPDALPGRPGVRVLVGVDQRHVPLALGQRLRAGRAEVDTPKISSQICCSVAMGTASVWSVLAEALGATARLIIATVATATTARGRARIGNSSLPRDAPEHKPRRRCRNRGLTRGRWRPPPFRNCSAVPARDAVSCSSGRSMLIGPSTTVPARLTSAATPSELRRGRTPTHPQAAERPGGLQAAKRPPPDPQTNPRNSASFRPEGRARGLDLPPTVASLADPSYRLRR